MLIATSSGQDYLDGGYAGSGDYGDIGQYFTDPIFYSPGYASSDPAVSEMQESMDRYGGSVALGSAAAKKYAARKANTIGKTTANAPTVNAAGRWHLELSEGRSIDLDILQIGERIFGRGSMGSGMTVQPVTASGSISGSSMVLDVVTETGTELYAISIDVNRLHLASPYTVFREGGKTGSGTLRALRVAPHAITTNH
ncbi:MAG: hypothetical protein ACE14P_04980 [Methanotrichaceae archaeon]